MIKNAIKYRKAFKIKGFAGVKLFSTCTNALKADDNRVFTVKYFDVKIFNKNLEKLILGRF